LRLNNVSLRSLRLCGAILNLNEGGKIMTKKENNDGKKPENNEPAGQGGAADGDGQKSETGNENASAGDGQGGSEGDEKTVEVYIPEGLPEHMQAKTNQEIIDNLHKAYKGARDELAGKTKVPEKLEDYNIDLGDLAEKVLKPGEDGKDPVFEKLRGIMHENKIAPEAANALAAGLYEAVAEQIEAGGDAGGEAAGDFDYQAYGGEEKAKPVIDGVNTWAQGLKNQGRLDDSDIEEIQLMAMSSEGLRVLSKLREATGEKPIPANFSEDSGKSAGITQGDLDNMIADPKYWRDKDPAFVKKVTDGFKELYGSDA
jgi:hypothetical protein